MYSIFTTRDHRYYDQKTHLSYSVEWPNSDILRITWPSKFIWTDVECIYKAISKHSQLLFMLEIFFSTFCAKSLCNPLLKVVRQLKIKKLLVSLYSASNKTSIFNRRTHKSCMFLILTIKQKTISHWIICLRNVWHYHIFLLKPILLHYNCFLLQWYELMN